MFDQIQPDNVQKIMEGIIMRLQRELQEALGKSEQRQLQIKRLKARAVIQLVQTKPAGLNKTTAS